MTTRTIDSTYFLTDDELIMIDQALSKNTVFTSSESDNADKQRKLEVIMKKLAQISA